MSAISIATSRRSSALTGHLDRAAEALERALAAYEQKGLVPMAERTRRELAELRG